MKTYPRYWKPLFQFVLAIMFGLGAGAAVLTFPFENLNRDIPDGSALGLSDSQNVVAPAFNEIVGMKVKLHVTGGFNGDLYIQLIHGSGMSVLMNRVGRMATNEFGYGDSGFDIVFSDNATAGDVHAYRTTLFGNESTSLVGALSGVWAPDGRTVDPDFVVETSARSATFSTFTGADPNGTWTLFIADMEGGGVSTLQSWELELTVVPEPGCASLLATLVLASFLRRRR